jgi:thermostable 8-oxoguanine DNA glycosylase
MKYTWEITDADVAAVKRLLNGEKDHPWVKDRFARNLHYPKKEIAQSGFWTVLVCMRCTTLAHSGEGSPIETFQGLNPFPLLLERIRAESKATRESFIHATLGEHMVGTHRRKIAADLVKCLNKLDGGQWPIVLERCNSLLQPSLPSAERSVADLLEDELSGIGPKQARNILQDLGLTRFEIPIDSRVMEWLNDSEPRILPFQLTSIALADKHCYGFILDIIQELCEKCVTFPCVLDASIFSFLEKQRIIASGRGVLR